MYDSEQDLLDALRATPDVLDSLVGQYTPEQARAIRSGDEGWTAVEIICHLRDAEERAVERMTAMRDQEQPFLPGYDQEVWARERNYAAQDLVNALADFKRYRAQHVAALAGLSRPQWQRIGWHAEFGEITIFSHALHIAAHDLIHAAQLARGLRRSQA